MSIFMRKQVGKQRYLCIGPLSLPYSLEKFEGGGTFRLAGLSLKYTIEERDNAKYYCFCGIKINSDHIFYNRKKFHYEHRDELTEDYCIKLLQKELQANLGYVPDIKNPRSFNEKILWSKFHVHDPLITTCCDKYAVKDYVAGQVGAEYVLPVLGVWERPEDVDFAKLPDKFALKVNWSSGYNIIVKDKSKLNLDEVRAKLACWLQPGRNSYYDTFNWGYKDMKPVIFAEPYIEQLDGQLTDYKLFICNGRYKFMFIATDRLTSGVTYTYFDDKFEHLPFTYGKKPNANPLPDMPRNLEKVISIAEKLAEPFKFVRVDFYELPSDEIYVGEMTFYCGGGTLGFNPVEWDYKLGELIDF